MNRKFHILSLVCIVVLFGILLTGCNSDKSDEKSSSSNNTDTHITSKNADKVHEIATLNEDVEDEAIGAIAVSPDGSLIASAGTSSSVYLWSVKDKTKTTVLEGLSGPAREVLFSADGSTVSGLNGNWSSDEGYNKLLQWDVQSYAQTEAFTTINIVNKNAQAANQMAMSPDGRWLALDTCTSPQLQGSGLVCGITGVVLVDLTSTDSEADSPFCPSGTNVPTAFDIAFSPASNLVAVSGAGSATVCDYDDTSAQVKYSLVGVDYRTLGLAFSPDGKILAVSVGDKTIHLFDAETGESLRVIDDQENTSISLAFSPDNSVLAAGGTDNSIHLWETSTGKLLATLSGHSDYVVSVFFSADGKFIASASYDNTIRLWAVK